MPDSCLYNAQMNTTNVTTGAYIGSEMYSTTSRSMVRFQQITPSIRVSFHYLRWSLAEFAIVRSGGCMTLCRRRTLLLSAPAVSRATTTLPTLLASALLSASPVTRPATTLPPLMTSALLSASQGSESLICTPRSLKL